jgi:hypothetical protein
LSTYDGAKSGARKSAPIRKTKRRASRGGVWFIFRVVVALALCGCSLYWLGAKVSRPFSLLRSTGREVREINAKLQEVRTENEGLRRGILYMQTAEGKAQAGRWSGLVKPGERRLLVPEDPGVGSTPQ